MKLIIYTYVVRSKDNDTGDILISSWLLIKSNHRLFLVACDLCSCVILFYINCVFLRFLLWLVAPGWFFLLLFLRVRFLLEQVATYGSKEEVV